MTNSIAIIVLLSTNWVATGTFTDNQGHRFEEQAAWVSTNVVARSVTVITNDVILRSSEAQTNGATRRLPQMPPLPTTRPQ